MNYKMGLHTATFRDFRGQGRGGEVEDGTFCKRITAVQSNHSLCPGTFQGGEIEPGTFHENASFALQPDPEHPDAFGCGVGLDGSPKPSPTSNDPDENVDVT